MSDFRLDGVAELQKKLNKLEQAVAIRVLSSAASYAMTPVVGAARRAVPRGSVSHKTYRGRTVAPGFLSRNIKKKTRRWKNKQGVTVMVGPTKEAFYGQFLEFGKDKKHRQSAKPWLEPAFKGVQDKVLSRFKSRLKDKIKAASK